MAAAKHENDIPNKLAKKQITRFREQVEADVEELHMQYLNIMPMMDMMTILLVFLLKQFSVQASAMAASEGMVLPSSSVEKTSPVAVNITVTQNAILVEGDAVAPVRGSGAERAVDPSVKRDGANGYYITPLVDVLNKHANRLKKIGTLGGTPFDSTAMVMVDKGTPYRLLSEVLYSAGQAEFRNYRLVVIKKGQ
jgi:biopolymer transport protein ExbD